MIGSPFLGGVEIGDFTFPKLSGRYAEYAAPIVGALLLFGFVPLIKSSAPASEELTAWIISRGNTVIKDLDLIIARLRALGSALRQREGKVLAADDAMRLAGKVHELRLTFHQLHSEHVDANRKGHDIQARDIDKKIQHLITSGAKPLFNSVIEDEGGAKIRLIDFAISFRHDLDPEVARHINDLRD